MPTFTPSPPQSTQSTQSSPSRALPLSGASNFRDLGGYTGYEGRAVVWRKLFRSDHLGLLNAADVAQVQALGLARVLDFRGRDERVPQACALPNVAVHSLAIEPTVVQAIQALLATGQGVNPNDAVRLMQDTYRAFVVDSSPRFAELFDHLLESDTPLVFHCTAGKDRTGFAAALVLMALGVPRDVVVQDYLLTNELFRPPELVGSYAPQAVRDVIVRVQTGFLDASMAAVDKDFGGMPNYLEKAMGLDASRQQRLRDLYLQA